MDIYLPAHLNMFFGHQESLNYKSKVRPQTARTAEASVHIKCQMNDRETTYFSLYAFLYSFGVMPVDFLNTVWKYA